jgi:hypothetical protein
MMQAVEGLRSKETVDLRLKSLQTLRMLMEIDDLVGVKFFKMKILSNIIIHIIPSNITPGADKSKDTFKEQTYYEVIKIIDTLKNNKYREQLVIHS